MRLKVSELAKRVSDGHIQLRLDIHHSTPFNRQASQFVEELRTVANVITTRCGSEFYIVPKKTKEETREGLTIRHYKNGVIEKIGSLFKNRRGEEQGWEGCRVYPDGRTETGRFQDFRRTGEIHIDNRESELKYFVEQHG